MPINNGELHPYLFQVALVYFLHTIKKVVRSRLTTERLENDDANEHYWREREGGTSGCFRYIFRLFLLI